MPIVLYSTNTFIKFRIQRDFRNHKHHVWCSPVFDARSQGAYAVGAGQPATSDPASIYRYLCDACRRTDDHNEKIAAQKKTLVALATLWHSMTEIDMATRDEIAVMVDKATFRDWRPLIFVIPYGPVSGRVELVDRARRASSEPEYIIKDLADAEFDIIEP